MKTFHFQEKISKSVKTLSVTFQDFPEIKKTFQNVQLLSKMYNYFPKLYDNFTA